MSKKYNLKTEYGDYFNKVRSTQKLIDILFKVNNRVDYQKLGYKRRQFYYLKNYLLKKNWINETSKGKRGQGKTNQYELNKSKLYSILLQIHIQPFEIAGIRTNFDKTTLHEFNRRKLTILDEIIKNQLKTNNDVNVNDSLIKDSLSLFHIIPIYNEIKFLSNFDYNALFSFVKKNEISEYIFPILSDFFNSVEVKNTKVTIADLIRLFIIGSSHLEQSICNYYANIPLDFEYVDEIKPLNKVHEVYSKNLAYFVLFCQMHESFIRLNKIKSKSNIKDIIPKYTEEEIEYIKLAKDTFLKHCKKIKNPYVHDAPFIIDKKRKTIWREKRWKQVFISKTENQRKKK